MPGRKPKPTALKELAGNPGRRPLNTTEPKPSGIPDCPEHLDAEAKKEWARISIELINIGLLTSVDRAALAAYCQAYSRWTKAEDIISKTGLVFTSPKSGYPVQSPYIGISNTALDQMRKFATEFGLTPASRTRLHVDASNKPNSTFEDFMSSIGAVEDISELTETEQIDNEQASDHSRAIR